MAEYIVVPGKVDILVACNFAFQAGALNYTVGQFAKLGESADEIQIQLEQQNYPVPGDRNGGRAGDSVEEQFMSMTASTNLELSMFDPEVADVLNRAGGLMTIPGKIQQNTVGDFFRKTNSYMFKFRCTIEPSRSVFFPCVSVQKSHILGGGTKFEMFRAHISMHRSPPGHWADPSGEDLTNGTLFVQDESFFVF